MEVNELCVAIPSNRVNVSYIAKKWELHVDICSGRNPLKSGQCFLLLILKVAHTSDLTFARRNPLKSGQCFLQVY